MKSCDILGNGKELAVVIEGTVYLIKEYRLLSLESRMDRPISWLPVDDQRGYPIPVQGPISSTLSLEIGMYGSPELIQTKDLEGFSLRGHSVLQLLKEVNRQLKNRED